MNSRLLLPLLLAILAACSNSTDTTEEAEGAELAVRPGPGPKVVCAGSSECACVAEAGCGWDATANECLHVGDVVPHDPVGVPAGPTVLCLHTTEAACIAERGCGWDGSAQECVYVGEVEPQ
jgi:hypothetical protein